jgi:hypothetical protein
MGLALEAGRSTRRIRMYAQMVDTGVKAVATAADMSADEQAFQARIDADIKIEPKDWMPDAYRKTLVRQISQRPHAGAQGDPDGQGAGRGRPWAVSLLGSGNARRVAR